MSLSGSRAAPTEVFYVVQSTGARGRREHRLASVLYEMRPHAHTELARLSAAHSGDFAVWKSATYIEPPQWGYAVMRADGTVVPPGAVGGTCGPLPRGPAANRLLAEIEARARSLDYGAHCGLDDLARWGS
jgi:hypothetical protein